MSKRKHEQSFCYAPSRECGCILSIQSFSGNSSRGWRRRKYAGIIHIPGCICHFALGFCKNIKKRTETLYQSFSPFMVEMRRVELLSEGSFTELSPSAVRDFSFPPPYARGQAEGISSFINTRAPQSLSALVPRANDVRNRPRGQAGLASRR